MSVAGQLAVQALAEYSTIASSSSAGITAVVARRAQDVLRFAEDNLLVIAGIALGAIVLWRVLTRPAIR